MLSVGRGMEDVPAVVKFCVKRVREAQLRGRVRRSMHGVAVAVCAYVAVGSVGDMLGHGGSAVGQERAVVQSPAAAARARANDDLERLRSEIRLLTELRDAQEALRGWNRLRVEAGEAETVLDAELCGRLGAWCAALPGTFGRAVAGGARR